ncbi:mitochondrial fission regulator 2 [Rhineura floridana]|uniref:mitochondrial fission regulator 2 n=1 Tax=Rhineura floridana TaxID=261503 RepID=UPI002AC82D1B|nr:mitochondrial fission regulator 2 [Rhineura floridana]XP_061482317.1 mitochondrial fission regulator 2 [Rhineura floridana]XP_061482318.1 mitochondrial fission regulator 2 [Rhineura floridana]XP_061482319.1 mitochondrial fission regulator 2 [Rhineura floridana]XP_061482320.1 mitochondrial fission regulator 2 [Rhineura floridana]
MSLVLNLLRQLLEYYGVPAELLVQRCEVCLNGFALMIASHLPSNTFSGARFLQLCGISRSCAMSWAWERKKYGSTRSFVRRLGKCLSLTPCPRPRFQAIQSLNSLTPEQSSTIGSVTPSLADVLWVADDDGEPYARFRFDERRGLVSAASKGRMKKSLIVNEDAFKKISALENELAHLRAQIAGIVAIHRPGNDQSCSSTVNLSNIPFSALPQPEMTSTPVPSSLCNIVVPPPPPPLPPSDFDSRKSAIELIKQRRAASKITKVTDSAGWQNAKAVPSMMEVLKDINKVKLRAVERSPGGTPLPKTKKITQSRWDPAALIAEALKEKFASQGNDDNESFDKENRFYGASPFSSPDTPEVGCRILKPSKKQTLIRANELM